MTERDPGTPPCSFKPPRSVSGRLERGTTLASAILLYRGALSVAIRRSGITLGHLDSRQEDV
jgi:hypothetical protein